VEKQAITATRHLDTTFDDGVRLNPTSKHLDSFCCPSGSGALFDRHERLAVICTPIRRLVNREKAFRDGEPHIDLCMMGERVETQVYAQAYEKHQ
jgi:hypothetical protein